LLFINLQVGDKLIVTKTLPKFHLQQGVVKTMTQILKCNVAELLFYNDDSQIIFTKICSKTELKVLKPLFVKKK
jgi:hypothetical protein